MKLELHATPEEVMRAVELLEQFGGRHGVSERDVFALTLVLEESASNVVNHALKRDSTQKFQVSLRHTGSEIVIELRDRGPEFDPTLAAKRATEDEPHGDPLVAFIANLAPKPRRRNSGQQEGDDSEHPREHLEARPVSSRLAASAVSSEQASSGQTNHEAKLGGEVEVGIVIARAAEHSSSAALLEESDDLVQLVMDVE